MTTIGPNSYMPPTSFARPATSTTQTQSPATGSAQPKDESNAQESSANSKSEVVTEFLKWAKMSPAERIRAQYLEAHGLSEEAMKSMSPKERQKIEDEIAELIKEKLGQEGDQPTGTVVDQLA